MTTGIVPKSGKNTITSDICITRDRYQINPNNYWKIVKVAQVASVASDICSNSGPTLNASKASNAIKAQITSESQVKTESITRISLETNASKPSSAISLLLSDQQLGSLSQIAVRKLRSQIIWSGSRWNCSHCRLSGDRFFMVSHICSQSKVSKSKHPDNMEKSKNESLF